MLGKNKRTSDSKMPVAPAAQGVGIESTGLWGALVDEQNRRVGVPFPVKMTVAVAGEVENENSISIVADRTTYVSGVELQRGDTVLATIALTAGQKVSNGDTLEFCPGSMTITMDGPFRDTLIRTLVEPADYVINEEPTLD